MTTISSCAQKNCSLNACGCYLCVQLELKAVLQENEALRKQLASQQ
eukprot:COSAG01_NODE_3086_length_6611_cov_12.899109_4_plen_46_part_00